MFERTLKDNKKLMSYHISPSKVWYKKEKKTLSH